MSRYSRQQLLPQVGLAGQEALRAARVLLVGCGALGTVLAEQLVRSGLGFVRIVDRDIVEESNLQRQSLFDESQARSGMPKAIAAAERLGRVNGDVAVESVVAELGPENIESLAGDVQLLLDGTDNAFTRYLINDYAVKTGRPWVYGACVGVEGRAMPVLPGGPCLRCVFADPPAPGELPTCDTAGVLSSAAAVVASLQATMALRILLGDPPAPELLRVNVWTSRLAATSLIDARRPDCRCCGRGNYEFLYSPADRSAALCGRDAVQIRPASRAAIDLATLSRRLETVATVERTPYLLRASIDGQTRLTVFPDGRAIVHGTHDVLKARSLYDRFVGG